MVTFASIPTTKDSSAEVTATDRLVYADQLSKLPAKLAQVATSQGFKAKPGDTLVLPSSTTGKVEVLVGLGAKSEVSLETLRKASHSYAKAVAKHQVISTKLAMAGTRLDKAASVRAVAEAIQLATYVYDARKGLAYEPSEGIERVELVTKVADAEDELAKAAKVADSVSLARDLGNEPGGNLTPEAFASVAEDIAASSGLDVEVWDKDRIQAEKLGGVLAVNQGSSYEPRLVKLSYKPENADAHVVLVGKGITFDSGGLSLKTPKGMQTMKIDMAGGAAVLATMSNLAKLGCPIAVTGIIPLTDNMTGGYAQRPGDVFTARNGKTVEVLNTDAEGRLILADGLSLASELKPDAILDIATLTGSASVALGTAYAAVMSTDAQLTARLFKSCEKTGEKMWELPLPQEYRPQLDSFVADVKNIGSGAYGGTSIAGLFLKEFVDAESWLHIDLGLSAFAESAKGIQPKGATGFAVRSLTQLLCDW